jgi:hypothetical protein
MEFFLFAPGIQKLLRTLTFSAVTVSVCKIDGRRIGVRCPTEERDMLFRTSTPVLGPTIPEAISPEVKFLGR